jgi:hypothetical protein
MKSRLLQPFNGKGTGGVKLGGLGSSNLKFHACLLAALGVGQQEIPMRSAKRPLILTKTLN